MLYLLNIFRQISTYIMLSLFMGYVSWTRNVLEIGKLVIEFADADLCKLHNIISSE